MSPYPMDRAAAVGPMRLVLTTFPDRATAVRLGHGALKRRLAACVQFLEIESAYHWKGRIELSPECLTVFKTAPKRVGALFRYLAEAHPYDVPEIIELDVPRVHAPYLRYLASTVDREAPPPPLGGGRARLTRRGSRRAPGARRPGRTPGPRRPRSRHTGRRS
ncbi:MAG: divalent-cation tolerance protein CutA [Thermoplasmata archaeon]|nr:divalent-cation tolerance protein CutA [Thermoplasmata archaeon]